MFYQRYIFPMARKVSLGRRKIPMKMIPAKDARQVAFSKRRASLFRKAHELCTLTGAQVVIIVFSPGGKPYSFGHPSVEEVINRFLNLQRMPNPGDQDHQYVANVASLNHRYNELRDLLEEEKKRGEKLKQMEMERRKHSLVGAPVDELNVPQLMFSKMLMENLRDKVAKRIEELSIKSSVQTASSSLGKVVGDFDLNLPVPDEMEE